MTTEVAAFIQRTVMHNGGFDTCLCGKPHSAHGSYKRCMSEYEWRLDHDDEIKAMCPSQPQEQRHSKFLQDRLTVTHHGGNIRIEMDFAADLYKFYCNECNNIIAMETGMGIMDMVRDQSRHTFPMRCLGRHASGQLTIDDFLSYAGPRTKTLAEAIRLNDAKSNPWASTPCAVEGCKKDAIPHGPGYGHGLCHKHFKEHESKPKRFASMREGSYYYWAAFAGPSLGAMTLMFGPTVSIVAHTLSALLMVVMVRIEPQFRRLRMRLPSAADQPALSKGKPFDPLTRIEHQ